MFERFLNIKGLAGALALGLLMGTAGTWRVMSWKEGAAVTHQAQQTVRLVEHQAQITFNVSATYEGIKSNDIEATHKLVDEIPVRISPDSDAACTVGLGFIRLYNAATHGPIPDAASGPDGSSAGIALSTVAKTDIENAGQYDVLAAQLTALQDWIKQQQALAPK